MKGTMKKENFTAGRIASFNCVPGNQQTIYWDAKTPGLGVRITQANAKSYIFETRLNSKTLRITIGDVRSYSIPEAQRAATELKAYTDKGLDPRQIKADNLEKSAARSMREKAMSANLLHAWDDYIEENSTKIREPWGQRHINDHLSMSTLGGEKRKRSPGLKQEGLLRPLLMLNFKELNQSVITKWLHLNSQIRPTQTALAYRLLRAFYNWLSEHDVYKSLIIGDLLLTKKITSNVPKVLPRKVSLQREQLASWFKAVKTLPSMVGRVYLQVLLITGARREELAELQWPKVEFRNKVIHLKDKVDDSKIRTIPLTPYVEMLLLELKTELVTKLAVRNRRYKANEKLSEYVFPSYGASGYIVSPTHIIYTQALKREGLEHLAAHDLRRSFATMGEEADVSDGVIKQIMGHKPKSGDTTEAHYKVRTISRLRDKHIEIERWILEQAGLEQPKIEKNERLLTIAK